MERNNSTDRTTPGRCAGNSFRTPFGCVLSVFLIFSALTAASAVGAAEHEGAAAPAAEEKPYSVDDQGRIDWYTFSGYRRYHAECHVCHGPAGLGSSFAPNLIEAVKRNGYEKYLEVVINGIVNVTATAQNRMPAFATNMNVMCFVDDIYAYLVARADGVLDQGRPAKKQPKPEAAKERDTSCLGG